MKCFRNFAIELTFLCLAAEEIRCLGMGKRSKCIHDCAIFTLLLHIKGNEKQAQSVVPAIEKVQLYYRKRTAQ